MYKRQVSYSAPSSGGGSSSSSRRYDVSAPSVKHGDVTVSPKSASKGDTVTITGVALHAPAEPLYGHNDHRIVMALAVAVYAAGLPALLRGAEAVNKSWPAFWDTLRGLGAKIDTE